MPKPSTIDLLPAEIRSQLRLWLQDPRLSQEETTDRTNELLRSLGLPERVSKSGVNRAAVRWKKVDERMRQQREQSELWIGKFGAAPQGQTGLMINELLRTVAYEMSEKLLDADLDDPDKLPAFIDQIKGLSLTMQRLESAATNNVKREAEIKRQALDDAAKAVDNATGGESKKLMTADEFKKILLATYGA